AAIQVAEEEGLPVPPDAPQEPAPLEEAEELEVEIAEEEGLALAPDLQGNEDAPLQLAPPPPAAPVFEVLPEVWVLELSSFQLHGVKDFEPSAAVVLNVTQDHLDWHGTLPAYAADKARIYG